jgi:hypothetical protein
LCPTHADGASERGKLGRSIMLNFRCIVLKNGDVLSLEEFTNSHGNIIEHFGLCDNSINKFIHCDFCPVNFYDAASIEKYRFIHPEGNSRPDWFTDAVKQRSEEIMRVRIADYVISENRKFLPSGVYILKGKVCIGRAVNCRILYADQATIGCVKYSRIDYSCSARIETVSFSSIYTAATADIKTVAYSTIENAGDANIANVVYSTIINGMSAKIGKANFVIVDEKGSMTIENAESVIF